MARRLPPVGRAFTSGHYFTVWSWLITLPLAPTSLTAGVITQTTEQVSGALLAGFAVHIILGLILLVGGVLERRTTSSPLRITIVGATILAVCFARPIFSLLGTDWLGVALNPVDFSVLVATNVTVNLVAFTAIATAVLMVEDRRAMLSALARVAGALDESRTAGRELVTDAASVVAQAQDRLEQDYVPVQLASVAQRPAALRTLAGQARELSHRLTVPPAHEPQAVHVASARPNALAAPPPGIAIGALVLAMSPDTFTRYSTGAAISMTVISLFIGILGELGIRRFAHGPRQTAVVIGGAVLIALATLLAMLIVWGLRPSWIMEITSYVTLVVLAGWCTEIVHRLRDEETRLRDLLATYGSDEIDGRRRAEALLDRATTILHSDVQGECLRLAIQLDRGHPVDTVPLGLTIARLSVASQLEPSPGKAEIESVIDAWGYALNLTMMPVPTVVWNRLSDPAIARVIVEALSEAFTNTLKHADHPEATVTLDGAGDDGVRLSVASPGRLRGGHGRGLDDLRRTCDLVRLEEFDDTVILEIAVGSVAASHGIS